MAILNKTDLFYSLFDALRQHTDMVYFAGGANPYRFSFKGRFVTVFIGNLHSARRAEQDEYRIQCSGNLPVTLGDSKQRGDLVYVLGFSQDTHTFSAWDPDRFLVRNPIARRFSLYTRLSRMQEAAARGLAMYNDTDGQIVIQFRPDLIGLYMENTAILHQVSAQTLQRISETCVETRSGQPLARPIMVNRKKIQVTGTVYPRSPRFRQAVLGAYAHRCAMCGIQLDLVDAAHIVPHAHPRGLDIVNNGLALCALHHRSFDGGLLYVRGDYSIHLNRARAKHLRVMGRADGLNRFARQIRRDLLLPVEEEWLPAPENLVLGNDLRGVGLDSETDYVEKNA